jgi:hypothetical protein
VAARTMKSMVRITLGHGYLFELHSGTDIFFELHSGMDIFFELHSGTDVCSNCTRARMFVLVVLVLKARVQEDRRFTTHGVLLPV